MASGSTDKVEIPIASTAIAPVTTSPASMTELQSILPVHLLSQKKKSTCRTKTSRATAKTNHFSPHTPQRNPRSARSFSATGRGLCSRHSIPVVRRPARIVPILCCRSLFAIAATVRRISSISLHVLCYMIELSRPFRTPLSGDRRPRGPRRGKHRRGLRIHVSNRAVTNLESEFAEASPLPSWGRSRSTDHVCASRKPCPDRQNPAT